jgi:hypothetical protein
MILAGVKQEVWLPDQAGERCAQALHEGADPQTTLTIYQYELDDYYEVVAAHNTDQARIQKLRWAVRAASAPLLHGIEMELAKDIAGMLQPDGSIPDDQLALQDKHIDYRMRNAHSAVSRTPTEWAYLRATGSLAYQAGVRYLSQIHKEPGGQVGSLFKQFETIDTDLLRNNTFPKGFRPREDPKARLLDHVMTSNSTLLDAFKASHIHNAHEQTEQLGWLASVSKPFFDRYITNHDDAGGQCPFTGPEQRAATGNIWSAASLTDGPWRSARYCLGNIPLWDGKRYVSAATMRIENALPIARQMLWGSGVVR